MGRKAVDDYGMIKDGDKIAVGLSGGKDSLALLCMLQNMQMFYPQRYELAAITVDMGFDGSDFTPLIDFCAEIGIEYKIVRTQLADLIFNQRKESNPCSLCARMRRGMLHDAVNDMGFNKLALGHHFDDAVETFMLNLFNEGRIGSFSPVTYLSRKEITMIRPLIYAHEKDIRYFINKNPDLPLIKSLCPEDKHTERENIKVLLDKLDRENKGLKHRIFTAIQKSGIDGY
jgi:Predicted ATPase of the PP-loop superfamily implicated in cell cycle control